jgi:hypothetical protein
VRVIAFAAGLAAGMVLALAPATAQQSCGGVLQPPCPTTTAPGGPPPPPAGRPTPLSSAEFSAIEATLASSVPLDKGDTAARRRAFRRSCVRLDRRDLLLAAYRRLCLEESKLYVAYAGPCYSRSTCVPKWTGVHRTTGSYVREFRRFDAELESLVSDSRCRTALRSPPGELAAYGRFNRAVSELIAGFRSRSAHRLRAAARNLNRVSKTARKVVRSNRKQLSDFRSGCD